MLALPLGVQYALIGIAVILSLWVVLSQQLPATVRRLRVALALRMLRDGSGWSSRIGTRIAPPGASAGTCGSCSGCGSSSAKR